MAGVVAVESSTIPDRCRLIWDVQQNQPFPVIKTAKITFLTLIVALLASAFYWNYWYSGRVVAEAHFRSGKRMPGSDLTCIIREYPQTNSPFTNCAYFYGCEVRFRQVLLSSVAFYWDSFYTEDFSIKITSPDDVLFSIGDHRIQCSGIGWCGATWSTPRTLDAEQSREHGREPE